MNQREIKIDNAVYCVQRHFLGESSMAASAGTNGFPELLR